MSAFSLVHGAWMPVRLLDGTAQFIAPFEITKDHTTNPAISFEWSRPDFDLAAHELLIGLLAAIYPAKPNNPSDWIRLFHEPPRPDALLAAFEPFANAFVLDGDRQRFLQDFEPIEGEESPIDALFIEAPGANTVKLNKDLFIKRGQTRVLSRATAAMALYTLQQFAPSGGAGHRTSLRGGGPLVTLALPDGGPESHPTLWQRLWLNTPDDLRLDAGDMARAFPWLAPTRTSAKKEEVNAKDPHAHPLQAFFGMPRRIRLVFRDNVERFPCDLTGEIDDIICTGFVSVPWGVNYGVWRHPTSPYYQPKGKSGEPAPAPLPVHAPEGRLGYRQWLGLVKKEFRAKVVSAAVDRLIDLDEPWSERSRLLAGGYAMDNMKALAFAEAEMPLLALPHAYAQLIERFAQLMVDGSTEAAKLLGLALKRALYGEKAEVKFDSTPLDTARERLWELTEAAFHKTLDEGLASLRVAEGSDVDGMIQERLGKTWRDILERTALTIFDDTAPVDALDVLEPENVVEGRKFLDLSLKGYGKSGAAFFKALGDLEVPEPKKKTSSTSKAKTKTREDISQ